MRTLAVAVLLLSGCVQHWGRVGAETVVSREAALEIRAPAGWVRSLVPEDVLSFTRDGPGIQLLVCGARELDRAFPALERGADESLLPSELAELALGELKTRAGLSVIEVLGSEPAKLAGRDGFRLYVRHTDASGLRFDSLLWGVVDGERYLRAWYRAPTLHYFERDRVAVERSVATFRAHR